MPIPSPLPALFMAACLTAFAFTAHGGEPAERSAARDEMFGSTTPETVRVCRAFGRGVNLGNVLESPKNRQWGSKFEPWMIETAHTLGFDSIRLPVRWSDYAEKTAPYTIEAGFFGVVDSAVRQATELGMPIIVNVHHYEELYADPEASADRFVSLWRQIGEHFRDAPPSVVFELLNEPHDKLTPDRWNSLLPRALAAVRASNPTRAVIVGPGRWNSIGALDTLHLPDDPNLIVTVHCYDPFRFTHQGAGWVGEHSKEWVGTEWRGTEEERAELRALFETVKAWGSEHGRPMHLGEFGAFHRADMDSRVLWTRAMRDEAERAGCSWHYWELASYFGVVSPEPGHERRQGLIEALLGE
ncbi:MAG: glycoside hydrolase family 5 protein [Phycisphaeraceae bacterium]|nr:MAG: glycoside hydrolase family 5 protein [Phycisphaeraceae bacterium]